MRTIPTSVALFCAFISALTLKAQKITHDFNWLPIDRNVSLGMTVEGFRVQNATAKPLGKREFLSNGEREEDLIFSENLDGEQNSLKSKEKARYFFFDGFLTRIEWKNSEQKIGSDDALMFERELAQKFGKAVTTEQYFFVGKSGVARFLKKTFKSNGCSIDLIANNRFVELTITDNELLEEFGKTDLMRSTSDDFAIKETYGEGVSEITNPPEIRDFFRPRSNQQPRGGIDSSSEQGNRLNSEINKSQGEESDEQVKKLSSFYWLYWLLGLVVVGGLAKLVLNNRKV